MRERTNPLLSLSPALMVVEKRRFFSSPFLLAFNEPQAMYGRVLPSSSLQKEDGGSSPFLESVLPRKLGEPSRDKKNALSPPFSSHSIYILYNTLLVVFLFFFFFSLCPFLHRIIDDVTELSRLFLSSPFSYDRIVSLLILLFFFSKASPSPYICLRLVADGHLFFFSFLSRETTSRFPPFFFFRQFLFHMGWFLDRMSKTGSRASFFSLSFMSS